MTGRQYDYHHPPRCHPQKYISISTVNTKANKGYEKPKEKNSPYAEAEFHIWTLSIRSTGVMHKVMMNH